MITEVYTLQCLLLLLLLLLLLILTDIKTTWRYLSSVLLAQYMWFTKIYYDTNLYYINKTKRCCISLIFYLLEITISLWFCMDIFINIFLSCITNLLSTLIMHFNFPLHKALIYPSQPKVHMSSKWQLIYFTYAI
jgi:hypothetical protein